MAMFFSIVVYLMRIADENLSQSIRNCRNLFNWSRRMFTQVLQAFLEQFASLLIILNN